MTSSTRNVTLSREERAAARVRGWFATGEYEDMLKAVRHKDCPVDVLLEAIEPMGFAGHISTVGLSAIKHPMFPAEELARLALHERGGNNWYLGTSLFPHRNLPGYVVEQVLDEYYGKMSAGASEEALRKTLNTWDLSALLRRENCPARFLPLFERHSVDTVRQGVALNPNCPPDMQMRFARDSKASVRAAVAKNPNLAPEVQEYLRANPKGQHVQAALIRKGVTPETLLDPGSVSSHTPLVRRALARHSEDPATLERLAYDESASIRARAARNEACPEEGQIAAALLGAS